jgi:hypothetical protein
MIFVCSFVCIMREFLLSNFFLCQKFYPQGIVLFAYIGAFAAILKTHKLK